MTYVIQHEQLYDEALEKLKAHDPSDPQKRGSRAHTPGEWLEVRDPLLPGYPSVKRPDGIPMIWFERIMAISAKPRLRPRLPKDISGGERDSWEGKVIKEPRLTPCLHCF